ncbi:MAG: hypothetical protein ABSA67_02175 [Candidatus Brocadiia bacterium]|jgi:hypothetical protein
MDEITLLEPPAYTEDERQALVDFVLALRKSYVQEFLRRVDLPIAGAKPDLRERVQEALDEERLTHAQLVEFLDSVAPWGKQHVFLFTGPRTDVRIWRDVDHVRRQLERHGVGNLLNARLPLILPEKLTLSSIVQLDGTLRVTAVQKREYAERAPQHDEEKETEEGATVILKAYMNHLSRTLVAFEWNLHANTAMLQITQLPSDTLYQQVAKEYYELVSGWLDIEKMFGLVDICGAIRKLHELEEAGKSEARAHGIQYRTAHGRRLAAQSASPRESALGEGVINSAMRSIAKKGTGHLGNFYWLPKVQPGPIPNPLKGEAHVYVVGDKSRVNFPTPNSEDVVRYVLQRVRELS